MKTQLTYIIIFVLSIGLILSVKSDLQLHYTLKSSIQKQTEKEIELNSILWAIRACLNFPQ